MPAPRSSAQIHIRRRLGFVTAFVSAILPLGMSLVVPAAQADPFLPPPGNVYAGAGGHPISAYERAAGHHPPVWQVFSAWGEWVPGMFQDAEDAHARLMLSIGTKSGPREMITPEGIAQGKGDAWLISLNQAAFDSGLVVYVRLMAEMDGYWNAYSAYNESGPRGANHSTAAFKRAWKRVTLIMRGGSLASIDSQLHALGMPPLHFSQDLPRPKVAMMWCPQVAGAPDVAGNEPRDYWPGRRWVDWVGTDFYSKFPNFPGLNALYAAYPKQPFFFGEYAVWGADDPGWIRQLFGWVRTHRRARMLIYNEGMQPGNPLRLAQYPRAARALSQELASPRFPAFAPEWQS
jgi:hypothetical protein